MASQTWKNVLDLWVIQEIIHETQPEIVVEIGCKFGGTTLWLSDIMKTVATGRVMIARPEARRVGREAFVHVLQVRVFSTIGSVCPAFFAHPILRRSYLSTR